MTTNKPSPPIKCALFVVGADAGADVDTAAPAAPVVYRGHFWQITRPRRPNDSAAKSAGRRSTVLAKAVRSFARLLPRSRVQ
jgi:hypothetical protein